MASEYDYVIVGGGSSGSALAARLSEAEGVTVCLLEAGPRDNHPYVLVPAGFIKAIFSPTYTWSYETQPNPNINDRVIPAIQGRVLGGGGAINGMIWVRGQAEDFEDWEPGWKYDDVLPYFAGLERRTGPGEEGVRGRKGQMPVMDLAWKNPLVDGFRQAALAQGIPANDDYNGRTQEGVGVYQYNIDKGMRFSAAKAFLRPALQRKNLDLRCDSFAQRITFDGKRATGVVVKSKSGTETIRARAEVILCAGAINTPKLLQVSGVGPSGVLAKHGIAAVHVNENIGRNLQDHYTPRLTYRAKDVPTINGMARGPKLLGQGLRWLFGKPSIIGMGVVLGAVFTRSRPGLSKPNIVVTFTPATFKAGFLGRLDDIPGVTTGVWQLRPDSRGWVEISSPRIEDKPLIQPNFLDDEGDRQTVVEALKLARKIMAEPAIDKYMQAETMPGPDKVSDEDLLAYARAQGLSGYHYSGTCRMGAADNPLAVVGPDLWIHGLDGIRIADASVMPRVTSGNTNATAMMVGTKAADLIRGNK